MAGKSGILLVTINVLILTYYMDLYIGALGAFIILIAFILNQFGIWKNSDIRYDLVNVIGSILLIWYAVLLSSTPFIVLNIVWGSVSLRDVMIGIRRQRYFKKNLEKLKK